MTNPTLAEPSSTVTELRHSDPLTKLWSQADTFGQPSAGLTAGYGGSYQTIEVCVEALVDTRMVFTVATRGVTISWEREPERTYDDDVRAQVSALWAEDWDSDEDALYDDW